MLSPATDDDMNGSRSDDACERKERSQAENLTEQFSS